MADFQTKADHAQQMKKYVNGCHQFFEKTLTDLVLRQPIDPHAFLIKALENMSSSEREQWSQKMGSIGGRSDIPKKMSSTDTSPPTAEEGQIQVVLRLLLIPGDEIFARTLIVLEELRRNGKAMPGCLHFEIYKNAEGEIALLQTWASQQALDDYHSAAFFRNTTGKFNGLLADQPDFKVYKHYSL